VMDKRPKKDGRLLNFYELCTEELHYNKDLPKGNILMFDCNNQVDPMEHRAVIVLWLIHKKVV
jgi:hypothetical protein